MTDASLVLELALTLMILCREMVQTQINEKVHFKFFYRTICDMRYIIQKRIFHFSSIHARYIEGVSEKPENRFFIFGSAG